MEFTAVAVIIRKTFSILLAFLTSNCAMAMLITVKATQIWKVLEILKIT